MLQVDCPSQGRAATAVPNGGREDHLNGAARAGVFAGSRRQIGADGRRTGCRTDQGETDRAVPQGTAWWFAAKRRGSAPKCLADGEAGGRLVHGIEMQSRGAAGQQLFAELDDDIVAKCAQRIQIIVKGGQT